MTVEVLPTETPITGQITKLVASYYGQRLAKRIHSAAGQTLIHETGLAYNNLGEIVARIIERETVQPLLRFALADGHTDADGQVPWFTRAPFYQPLAVLAFQSARAVNENLNILRQKGFGGYARLHLPYMLGLGIPGMAFGVGCGPASSNAVATAESVVSVAATAAAPIDHDYWQKQACGYSVECPRPASPLSYKEIIEQAREILQIHIWGDDSDEMGIIPVFEDEQLELMYEIIVEIERELLHKPDGTLIDSRNYEDVDPETIEWLANANRMYYFFDDLAHNDLPFDENGEFIDKDGKVLTFTDFKVELELLVNVFRTREKDGDPVSPDEWQNMLNKFHIKYFGYDYDTKEHIRGYESNNINDYNAPSDPVYGISTAYLPAA